MFMLFVVISVKLGKAISVKMFLIVFGVGLLAYAFHSPKKVVEIVF